MEPYSPELGKLANIPIGNACTCWTDPTTGKGYILSINECLYFGDRLQQSLLNPNQLQNHGLIVDETPRQFESLRSALYLSCSALLMLNHCGSSKCFFLLPALLLVFLLLLQ
jgi:hypothetical protein